MTGFQSPNYTQAPNDLFDDWLRKLGNAELRVVLALIRLTLGYQRGSVRASLTKLCDLTGLSRQSVISGATALEQRGLIRKLWDGGVTEYILEINPQAPPTGQATRPLKPITGQVNRPLGQDTRPPTIKEKGLNKDSEIINGGQAPVNDCSPSTPGSYTLFNLLTDELRAIKRRPPKKFPSLACKAKFEEAEDRLGADIDQAITRALQKGILSLTGITDFVAKWGTNGNGSPRPAQSPPPPDSYDDELARQRLSAQALIKAGISQQGEEL